MHVSYLFNTTVAYRKLQTGFDNMLQKLITTAERYAEGVGNIFYILFFKGHTDYHKQVT